MFRKKSLLTQVNKLILKHRSNFFYIYSYGNAILNLLINSAPPFLRNIILKSLLGEFGFSSFIDYGSYLRYLKKIKIGNRVQINRGFQVYPSFLFQNCDITIEDDVVIAPNVTIYGAGQKFAHQNLVDVAGKITIRRGAYIGANSLIRYGVEIGEGSIVAAGSVVVKDVKAGSVVGGNPAKAIMRQ